MPDGHADITLIHKASLSAELLRRGYIRWTRNRSGNTISEMIWVTKQCETRRE